MYVVRARKILKYHCVPDRASYSMRYKGRIVDLCSTYFLLLDSSPYIQLKTYKYCNLRRQEKIGAVPTKLVF